MLQMWSHLSMLLSCLCTYIAIKLLYIQEYVQEYKNIVSQWLVYSEVNDVLREINDMQFASPTRARRWGR